MYFHGTGKNQAQYEVLLTLDPTVGEYIFDLRRFRQAVKLYSKFYSDEALEYGPEIEKFFQANSFPHWMGLANLDMKEMNDIFAAKVELQMDSIIDKAMKSYRAWKFQTKKNPA